MLLIEAHGALDEEITFFSSILGDLKSIKSIDDTLGFWKLNRTNMPILFDLQINKWIKKKCLGRKAIKINFLLF